MPWMAQARNVTIGGVEFRIRVFLRDVPSHSGNVAERYEFYVFNPDDTFDEAAEVTPYISNIFIENRERISWVFDRIEEIMAGGAPPAAVPAPAPTS